MAETPAKKRRIYIVGGKGKNVPPWITAAFDVAQFDQEHTRGREPSASNRPDAIVVLTSWVGHKHFFDGRDLADKLKIPLILSPGGWSAAIKSAADLGAEWFIKDIEAAKHSAEITPEQAADLTDYIDNAWREAYNREWSARTALEKRHESVRKELDEKKLMLSAASTRQEAADRVIREIRAAAKESRDRSGRLSAALSSQIEALEALHSHSSERSIALHQMAQEFGDLSFKLFAGLTDLKSSLLDTADDQVESDHVVTTSEPSSPAEGTSGLDVSA